MTASHFNSRNWASASAPGRSSKLRHSAACMSATSARAASVSIKTIASGDMTAWACNPPGILCGCADRAERRYLPEYLTPPPTCSPSSVWKCGGARRRKVAAMLSRSVALALCLLAQPVSADLGQLIAKLTAFASDAADSVSAPASAAEHALYTPPPLEHVEEDEDADSVIGRQLSATEAKKPKRKFCNTTVYALKGDYAYEACGSFCKQAKATNHCKCECSQKTCPARSLPARRARSRCL